MIHPLCLQRNAAHEIPGRVEIGKFEPAADRIASVHRAPLRKTVERGAALGGTEHCHHDPHPFSRLPCGRRPLWRDRRAKAMLHCDMEEKTPDAAAIEILADRALATIPDALRQHVDGVAIRVIDLPDEQTCADFGLESPYDLLGLYHGIPLDEQSVLDIKQHVDIIFLYRLPLLDYADDTGDPLFDVVRHVLIHEIGHHFGFSDEDMERIEAEADTAAE